MSYYISDSFRIPWIAFVNGILVMSIIGIPIAIINYIIERIVESSIVRKYGGSPMIICESNEIKINYKGKMLTLKASDILDAKGSTTTIITYGFIGNKTITTEYDYGTVKIKMKDGTVYVLKHIKNARDAANNILHC